MRTLARVLFGALVLSGACSVRVQGSERGHSVLARPVVIGASLSAGLSAGKDLAQVLEASLDRERGAIESACSVYFWRDPVEFGTSQAKFALQRDPTVLIAIDYLFWFGYGSRNLDGDPIVSGAERLELLRHGLRLLETFSCPIVLADFPRDRGQVARMISPAYVPSHDTVRELNQELRSWSAGRSNVIILPLARKLEQIWDGEDPLAREFTGRWRTTRGLLQSDGVHPTLEGLVWISHQVATEMVARRWIESSEVEQDPSSILDELGKGDPPSGGETIRTGLSRTR